MNHLDWAKDEPTDSGSPTLIATYIYDVFGNRIEKDVWTQQSGQTTVSRFGYDKGEPGVSALASKPGITIHKGKSASWLSGALSGGLANAWADLNGSNQLLTRYLESDDASPPLARISAAGVAGWYLADHLSSVRNLTDNSGTLIDTIAYDAYGKITSESSPSSGDRYKWALLQFDSEISLYKADEREFSPSTGRWLEQDPLSFRAGDTNLYRYGDNSPTIYTDPIGLQVEIVPAKIRMTVDVAPLDYKQGKNPPVRIVVWIDSRVGNATVKLELDKTKGTLVAYYTAAKEGKPLDQSKNPIKTGENGKVKVFVAVDSLRAGFHSFIAEFVKTDNKDKKKYKIKPFPGYSGVFKVSAP